MGAAQGCIASPAKMGCVFNREPRETAPVILPLPDIRCSNEESNSNMSQTCRFLCISSPHPSHGKEGGKSVLLSGKDGVHVPCREDPPTSIRSPGDHVHAGGTCLKVVPLLSLSLRFTTLETLDFFWGGGM